MAKSGKVPRRDLVPPAIRAEMDAVLTQMADDRRSYEDIADRLNTLHDGEPFIAADMSAWCKHLGIVKKCRYKAPKHVVRNLARDVAAHSGSRPLADDVVQRLLSYPRAPGMAQLEAHRRLSRARRWHDWRWNGPLQPEPVHDDVEIYHCGC